MAGVRPQAIEIEPGTVINIWVPNETMKNKPAVVFLHGFAADGIITWQFQVLALAKKCAIYVPDFLFFGGSITDKTDRSVSFQAECMAKALGQLCVRRCTVVGLSYGGMVGFKMAEMYPDLVESMVVTCSVMALTQSISNAGLQRIGFSSWVEYLVPNSVQGVKVLFKIACYDLPWLPNCIFKDCFKTMFNNRKEKNELLQALVISDKEFYIPHLPQKIHLLWGENDLIFDTNTAYNLKAQIGENATAHFIEKSGHLPHLERAWVYNKHLKKILSSLWEENGCKN
ncbi:hypothetical protein SLEP1_g31157 [Rubroshorea leprosula]|uniref:AB hydrolase-1 domain-containing protein n=1 Tax=Rubroshorea leprosula TaxID=152421 RepID=A0AAV5KA17_9ROSI|nr:hypothetical protein SLEP1_g31157 [Rubroshorea leprosula]